MKLREFIDKTDERLFRIEMSLDEHMRRTDAAEKNLDLLRQDFEPVKNHVVLVGAFVKGTGLVLGALAALVSIVAGILKILG